ncbi:L-rhamnose mutarotase [Novosphingobium organovorum]
MQLKPGNVEEYRARHDAIWPELSQLLHESGVRDYAIFLDEESLALFAVMHPTPDAALSALPDHPVMRRWWDWMAPLMEVEPDNRPREWPLPLLFHMD